MLKKSLIFSVLAISLLLAVQILWLSMVIKHEKQNYELKFKERVNAAVNSELRHRRARLRNIDTVKNKTFTTEFVSREDAKKEKSNKYAIGKKDVGGDPDFLGLTVDHFLQVYEKDHGRTFSITVFSDSLYHNLDSLGMGTSFTIYYSDFDCLKQYNFKGDKICFNQSFELSKYLTITKTMKIKATIYYPLSVYQGQFLSIIAFSVVLLAFIVFLLISQSRTLSAQLSLAKIKENLTRFFTHELRSPLQSALTGVEMIENSAGKGDIYSIQKYSDITKSKLQYINSFVERMLDINKLKSSSVKLNKVKFDLAAITSKISEEYLKNSEKEIELNIDNSCNVSVFGDVNHITHALSNLIENAVKYSGETVGIKMEVEKDRKFTTIIVEDNGIGIPEDDLKKIFDQFYRVNDAAHSIKSKGFGLGLNYVKWVAEVHKGRVYVESKVGVGSKFSLVISNI